MAKTSGAVKEDWLVTSEAARILKLSADRVRDLECTGLLPAIRTHSGQRLFRADDVERLARERAARRAEK